MKVVFVFSCFVVAFAMANSVQEKWNKVHQGCQSDPDLFVDEKIFKALREGKSPKLPANFGDHAFCMLNNLDLQDDEGNVLKPGVRQAVTQSHTENSDEVVHECSAIDKDTPEATALALFGCLKKYNVDIGQFSDYSY
nr:odorant binding protein 8 [Pachyrhinus yasumatsui]